MLRSRRDEGMKFLPFEEAQSYSNIVVDGAPGPRTVIALSHWPKSGTPQELLRDTSAAIAFAYLDVLAGGPLGSHTAGYPRAKIVTNDHFDVDGLVSLYILTHPDPSSLERGKLTDIASAGDFRTFEQLGSYQAAIVFEKLGQQEEERLRATGVSDYSELCGAVYSSALRRFDEVLGDLRAYESFWSSEIDEYRMTKEDLESGSVVLEEVPQLDLAFVTAPEGMPISRAAVFERSHASLMTFFEGPAIRTFYRYESWVLLVSRSVRPRVDLSGLAMRLNELEQSGASWRFGGVRAIIPVLAPLTSEIAMPEGRNSGLAPTSIGCQEYREILLGFLEKNPPSWSPWKGD